MYKQAHSNRLDPQFLGENINTSFMHVDVLSRSEYHEGERP